MKWAKMTMVAGASVGREAFDLDAVDGRANSRSAHDGINVMLADRSFAIIRGLPAIFTCYQFSCAIS